MGIPGKGVTTSLCLSTERPNKKQKARFSINDITNQYFKKFPKNFNSSPYLGYNIKLVHNKPTED